MKKKRWLFTFVKNVLNKNRTMKLSILLLVLAMFNVQANNTYSQNKKLSLDIENQSIENVLRKIESQSRFNFFYKTEEVDVKRKVSFKVSNTTIKDILGIIFKNKNVTYKVLKKQIVLKRNINSLKSSINKVNNQGELIIQNAVSGIIADARGVPLPGANVVEKGTSNGTQTNFDGKFSLNLASKDAILVISYLGFLTKEFEVKGQTDVTISLVEDAESLGEIVVVGYGVKSKATLTGAVSTVKGEELAKNPVANVSNSFAGRLSGVVANNRSGEPGEDGSTIRIRGISTDGNNSALVVIDGVANRLGGLERLNPNDIESVTVLKDATAAIYGAQAANGVILITTKRGKKGKMQVSMSHNSGFTRPTNLPDMADSPTYARISNEIRYYTNPSGGFNQAFSDAELLLFENGSNPDQYGNTDWLDAALKDFGTQDSQNISVRGGGENMTYFASLGRVSQGGIFKNGINKYDQINLRTNLDININKNLKVGIDVSVRREKRFSPVKNITNGEVVRNNFAGDIFRALYRTYPGIPAYYTNGEPSAGVEQGLNPVILPTAARGTTEEPTTTINSTLTFDYNLPFITEGLSLRGFYSEDKSFNSVKSFRTPFTVSQVQPDGTFNPITYNPGSGGPELYQSQANTSLKTANIRFNYDRFFNEHHISGFVAYEQQESDFTKFSAFRSGFLSTQIPEFNFGGSLPSDSDNNGFSTKRTRRNYFGRLSYDYAQKYLLEFQARVDGSSTFGDGNRYGFFPSISAGWRVSEEDWFGIEAIDNLKLKATFGSLGNDRVAPFQYLDSYRLQPADFVDINQNPVPIFIIAQLANPNITWEKAKKLDVGIDIGLFNNFDLEINYFKETRTDLLTARSTTIPGVSGIVNEFDLPSIIPQENIGEVENKGFEAILNYENKFGDFDFYASGNFTYNRNKVIFLDDVAGIPEWQIKAGKSLNNNSNALLYDAIGIFRTQADLDNNVTLPGQQLGDLIYRDVDNDGDIDADDRIREDLTNVPRIVYGLTLGGAFKNWDFSVLLQGQAQVQQYQSSESGSIGNFFNSWANNRWSPTNPNGSYPRVDTRTSTSINEGSRPNDFWLVNTAFLRIKTIELGYNLPENVLSSLGLDSARLYLSGFNLATFTKSKDLDPEGDIATGQFYPQMQVYNIGVNINF